MKREKNIDENARDENFDNFLLIFLKVDFLCWIYFSLENLFLFEFMQKSKKLNKFYENPFKGVLAQFTLIILSLVVN